MTVKGNVISDTLKNLITYFVVIIAIGGWVTKTEVNHNSDRKDIDDNKAAITQIISDNKTLLQAIQSTQQSVITGNKELSNQIFDIKLHQQEEDDRQNGLYKQIK